MYDGVYVRRSMYRSGKEGGGGGGTWEKDV